MKRNLIINLFVLCLLIFCSSTLLSQKLPHDQWGAPVVNVSHADQEGINFYYQAAEKGARHHLMIDIHGTTKPSGISRTYPNLLGYEGVLGMEQTKAGSRDNSENHVTLPFTRMLTGPMDYTPGSYAVRFRLAH